MLDAKKKSDTVRRVRFYDGSSRLFLAATGSSQSLPRLKDTGSRLMEPVREAAKSTFQHTLHKPRRVKGEHWHTEEPGYRQMMGEDTSH